MGEFTPLFEQFRENFREHPEDAAFLIAAGDRSVPITWGKFGRDIEEVAWIIRQQVPGAVVGLMGENSYEWITLHAAALFAGVTVVPVEMNLQAQDIAERLAFTGAAALVHSSSYAEKAQEVKEQLPGLAVVDFGTRRADRAMELARMALDAGDASVFDLPMRDEGDTATIVFTSGTTSKPRGAELTLAGIRTFANYAAATLEVEAGDRSLMFLPLHHIFGICTTYMMLANRVALGVCADFRRIFEAVKRFRADYLFLVPALAEVLAGKIAQKGRSAEEVLGGPLHWITIGGAPLARRTFEQLKGLGIKPLGIYGMTETTSLYSISTLDDVRSGSAGRAVGGYCGMETRVSAEGILQIRGPSVLKGYYKEPARTADVLDPDGWFTTGDIGKIDEQGYVWVTGRASRTIVLSSGKKVSPEELEEKILAIPGIHEAVVSGEGETREIKAEIYAVVSEETVRRQIASLNRRLPTYQRISKVVTRAEPFPRTSSGKIRVDPKAQGRPGAAYPQAVSPVQTQKLPVPKVRKPALVATAKFWLWALGGVTAGLLIGGKIAKICFRHPEHDESQMVKWAVSFVEEGGDICFVVLVAALAIVAARRGMFAGKHGSGRKQ